VLRWLDKKAHREHRVEGLPKSLELPLLRRFYVKVLGLIGVMPNERGLVYSIEHDPEAKLGGEPPSLAQPGAVVEQRGDRLVLLQRLASGAFEFLTAFRSPTVEEIEETAEAEFAGDCKLAFTWVIDTPILFVVGWNADRARALPVMGLGRPTWRPLADHLAQVEQARGSRPSVQFASTGAMEAATNRSLKLGEA
jgi:hypothetical protein